MSIDTRCDEPQPLGRALRQVVTVAATVRRLLPLLLAAALVAAGCGGTTKTTKQRRTSLQRFASRPDLRPTRVQVRTPANGTAPGYIFVGPKKMQGPGGLMIMNDRGQVVWYEPLKFPVQGTDFRVQSYHGRPVLTWWEGTQPNTGIGGGHYVIADDSYRTIATVRAGHGLHGDLHEFQLTPRGTAYITAYKKVPFDLTSIGGHKHAYVFDSVVQEVDVASGRVVFEWHSLGHVAPSESPQRIPAKTASFNAPFDYFHVNSVAEDVDGNLLVSARNTSTIYKIRRSDGAIIWRLGGEKSDFKMGPGTRFAWQHNAQRQPDGTITLFDNSAIPKVAPYSRALVLRADLRTHTATLVRAYKHPAKLSSPHQGDVQRLPNGDLFIGWGGVPFISEFAPDGTVLFDAKLAIGDTYRASRYPWRGHPGDRPAVVARNDGDRVVVYASWNGATDVARWYVLAGPRRTRVHLIAEHSKTGFETKIPVRTHARFVQVKAVDAAGAVLGTSRAVER